MKKISNQININPLLACLLLLLVFVTACQEDDPSPDASVTQNVKVNEWILENMQYWYLWNNQLPTSLDKKADPETFFRSLLNSQDRFSWIQDNYQELLNSLQGISKEAGYEYVLYKENESSSNVLVQVLYVKSGSPAEASGLKRGDIITHINDQQITTANYQTLLKSIRENHVVRYKPLLVDEQKFGDEKSVSLAAIQYTENPHHLTKVIETGGKRIGYYMYNFFANGTDSNPNVYDVEMDKIFSSFKSSGITDLVLDLRFNSGGSESSANSLASYVGKGIDNTKTFARRNYNSMVEKEIIGNPEMGKSFLTTTFSNKAANIGNMLNGGRIYILTSSRTASASELIINALKPFMEVFLIGDVTYGKNVGSISLYEENDPNNTWGLQPIVVKVYNSLDQSDYSNGFIPNVLQKDNSLYLQPLGDIKETLLSVAIDQITGSATTGRRPANEETCEIIGHSLDTKRRSFNLVIDENIPDLLTVQ